MGVVGRGKMYGLQVENPQGTYILAGFTSYAAAQRRKEQIEASGSNIVTIGYI